MRVANVTRLSTKSLRSRMPRVRNLGQMLTCCQEKVSKEDGTVVSNRSSERGVPAGRTLGAQTAQMQQTTGNLGQRQAGRTSGFGEENP